MNFDFASPTRARPTIAAALSAGQATTTGDSTAPPPTTAAAAATGAATAATSTPTPPFRLDEGFSEDTEDTTSNQQEEEAASRTRMAALLQEYVGSLSEHSRMEVAFEILQTLRAANIATVVERLAPYLHLDPMVKLPPEITSQIFEHLDAFTLLNASLASHTWRNRILDTELWKKLYINQGWGVNADAKGFDYGDHDLAMPDYPGAGDDNDNDRMHGLFHTGSTIAQVGSHGHISHPFKSQPTVVDGRGQQRLNWAFLYKQRHRLELNWTKGHFVGFQLPDPAFPYEAHTECVYTIQFVGKWLVSGSRDKTVRIWDLDTRRLVRRPLTGHTQSVLCLQFDPSPQEDVIISGSTDSSVIVWRFSTGQKLHEIQNAHAESVLNLRFDHRYLVTCSKDKKIKIWNRHLLSPTSPDFPRIRGSTEAVRVPDHIVDWSRQDPSNLEAKLASGAIKALPAYQLLMTFVGHGAAVNAIQIADDTIVSASGDRLIKIWKIKTGQMLRSIAGHQKGIACVQFDSKRIVSGSSDNTVRIFDPATGIEVAELKGHCNLVRTVQAGFGDLPGSDTSADLIQAARAAETKHAADLLRERNNNSINVSSIPPTSTSSRLAFGAHLPPGGGGSKWGKIVSGSYDESIIIWRKNADGDWVAGLKLQHDQASRSTQPPPQRLLLPPAVPQLPPQPRPAQPQHQHPPAFPTAHAQFHTPAQLPVPAPIPPLAPGVPNQYPQPQAQAQAQTQLHAQPQPQPQVQAQPQPQPQPQHGGGGGTPAARVFKLQFDARRIICCSQDSSIVGWDFANADPEIEEACKYFT